MRFGKKGKLSFRFIGPFEIVQQVGECAYHLALSPSLSGVCDVFHMSMFRKYIIDSSHMFYYSGLQLDNCLTLEEYPVHILDQEERVLRSRSIPFVKITWSHHSDEDTTWEREDQMRELYPHIFGK